MTEARDLLCVFFVSLSVFDIFQENSRQQSLDLDLSFPTFPDYSELGLQSILSSSHFSYEMYLDGHLCNF